MNSWLCQLCRWIQNVASRSQVASASISILAFERGMSNMFSYGYTQTQTSLCFLAFKTNQTDFCLSLWTPCFLCPLPHSKCHLDRSVGVQLCVSSHSEHHSSRTRRGLARSHVVAATPALIKHCVVRSDWSWRRSPSLLISRREIVTRWGDIPSS